MAKSLVINNVDIQPGTSTEVVFNIAKLPTHTEANLPVYVHRGLKDGPTLLLTASLHGDEVNGIEVIRRLTESENIKPDKGTVITIPVVNIFGFLQHSRELPDGKDLNRSFPGNASGSLAQRIAHTLIHSILPHVDVGIDFHTATVHRSNFPQIRCDFSHSESMELAKAFGAPLTINSKLRDKSFRKESIKFGKTIVVYEGGEGLRFNTDAIEEGIAGTRRVMKFLKMIRKAPKPHQTKLLTKSSWLRAQHAGLFRTFVKDGELVKKRQIIASITDPFGEFTYQIKSPMTGYILGSHHLPVVNKGDALLHIGMEGSV